jgi:hypothetical protein
VKKEEEKGASTKAADGRSAIPLFLEVIQ